MLPPFIVAGLFSSYILIMGLMFSQISHVSNSNASASSAAKSLESLRVKRDLIGLSGKELLKYFKTNLPTISSNSVFANLDHPLGVTKVSQLYDAFHDYLFGEDQRPIVQKLTQDVTIIPNVHSHNDYWRSLPLFEALMYGVTSVEADVWLTENNTSLSVSHDTRHIDPKHKSLDILYTQPLLEMLNHVNGPQNYHHSDVKEIFDEQDNKMHGVFYGDSSRSLQLLIDFKSENNEKTYELLMSKYLKPFIQRNYLTYLDLTTNEIIRGPLTIVLTGNYPIKESILDYESEDATSESNNHELNKGYFRDNKRYVFLDLPLHKQQLLAKLPTSVLSSASLSQLLTKCQSSLMLLKLRGHLSDDELKCIKKYINHAKEYHLATRIWGIPDWPISTRNRLWKQQFYDLNVDYINTDDLKDIANF